MAGGGLFDPLGTDRAAPARPVLTLSIPVVAAGLAVAALVALLTIAWLRDDGDRGSPRAISTIEHVTPQPKPIAPPSVAVPAPTSPAVPVQAPPTAASAGAPAVRDDQEVEIQNGVRIIRPRRAPAASGGNTIAVPSTHPPQR